MPFVQRILGGHIGKLKRLGGVSCSYLGIDGIRITLVMAPGLRTMESTTENNVVVDREVIQWRCYVSDLPRPPVRHDLIVANGIYYRVVHPGGGREYSHTDPWVFGYRINTILVEGEPQEPIPPPVEPPTQPPPDPDPDPDPEPDPDVTVTAYGPLIGGDTWYGGPDGTAYKPPEQP